MSPFLTYDDRLVKVASPTGTSTYQYDFDGNRVAATTAVGETRYLVDTHRLLSQVVAEYRGDSSVIASYTYADDLISMTRSGETFYYHFDGLGSTRELTDGTGAVTDDYDYNAFGVLIASAGNARNYFLYNAQQLEPESGWYYLRARHYQPGTGRFTSFDPFDGYINAPSTLHKYFYAANDPVNKVDPSGKFFGISSQTVTMGLVATLASISIFTLDRSLPQSNIDLNLDFAFDKLARQLEFSLIAASVVVVTVDEVMQKVRSRSEDIKKDMKKDGRKELLLAGPSKDNGAVLDNWNDPMRMVPRVWFREGGPHSGRLIGFGSWIPKRVNTYNEIFRFDNNLVPGYPADRYRHVYHSISVAMNLPIMWSDGIDSVKGDRMKSLRILDDVPSFYQIYKFFPAYGTAAYVFVDSYVFKFDETPSEEELQLLDSAEVRINSQIVLTSEMIERFGPHFATTANCIHVYDAPGPLNSNLILYKNLNWDWSYFCWDDSIVEIFINKDHTDSYDVLKSKYQCIEIEFPGLISTPGGLTIL